MVRAGWTLRRNHCHHRQSSLVRLLHSVLDGHATYHVCPGSGLGYLPRPGGVRRQTFTLWIARRFAAAPTLALGSFAPTGLGRRQARYYE